MGRAAEIVSAGAVVSRKGRAGPEVLLVHRPRYDDWSFPKGKPDPGEHLLTAAVREVAEETGLDVRLGPPLSTQTYLAGNGHPRVKDVHYWSGRVVGGDDDVATYRANDEVDQVAWLPVDEAPDRLTYPYDVDTLAELAQIRTKSYPLVVLRHGRARARRSWRGDDRDRTLTRAGEFEAEQMVPLLGAYGVERMVSSSSWRCWQTVAPYADVAGLDVEVTDDLSEEDATGALVSAKVRRLLDTQEPAVLCTHRKVLPWVFEALAVDDRTLDPSDLFVAHHRHGRVVAIEHHDVTFR